MIPVPVGTPRFDMNDPFEAVCALLYLVCVFAMLVIVTKMLIDQRRSKW